MAKSCNSNKFISFNCKSVKRSVVDVRRLCQSADIVALQETWLFPHDIPFLGSIHDDFEYTGKSAVDTSTGIIRGRPYGGVAILWRKSAFKSVSVISCDSARITAIKVSLGARVIVVCSVYMPTDSKDNIIEFIDILGKLSALAESSDVEAVFMLGDFNAHPGEPFWLELFDFCLYQKWLCADIVRLGLGSNGCTYISEANGSRRWLDHCVVTQAAWLTITDISIDNDVYYSDHFPVIIECQLNSVKSKVVHNVTKSSRVVWGIGMYVN